MNLDAQTKAALESMPVPEPAASARLFRAGCISLILICCWFLIRSGGDLSTGMMAGLGILVLSVLPALQWARLGRRWFPAFELFCLSSAPFYAFPLLIGHQELQLFSASLVGQAGLTVLLFLGCAILGFNLLRTPARPPNWALESLLPEHAYRYIPVGLLLNTVYVYCDTFTRIIPGDLSGSLRALFFGVGTLSTFVLAKLWGARALDRRARGFFVANLAAQIILLFAHLYLITGLSLLALAFIAFASCRRRVPWLPLLALLALLAILHNGKSQMRAIYWEGEAGNRSRLTVTGIPSFFAEWIGYGLNPTNKEGETQKHTIFERASLIQMLALCIDRVPAIKPHLEGESYIDIPAQIIPRFLWPGKPSSLLANIRLAVYFGFVDEANPLQVSIAFGVISEAYVNFGFIGVMVLGLVFGVVFRRLSTLSENAPQFSALGILMILLTAWSFQAEMILTTWIASLFQAAVVCVVLPLALRGFTSR